MVTLELTSLVQANILTTVATVPYILGNAHSLLAILDFGTGSNTATTFVSDTTISNTSKVDSMISADDTTVNHTASDHRYFPCFVRISATPVGSTGIQVYAQSEHKLTGQFKVRLVWGN